MMSEIKSMSTQCLFIYHNAKQKNTEEKTTTWLSKRRKVARKPKRTPHKANYIRLPQK